MNAAKNDSNRLFYIATGKFVACLDRASGEIAWQTELMRNLLTANMVFDGERIIVAGHRLVACLDQASGAARWQTKISRLGAPASIALDQDVPGGQIILACNGLLFSLWAETGQLLWTNGLEGYSYSPLCLRVPGAIAAQPVSHVVGGGNSARTVVKENIQYPG